VVPSTPDLERRHRLSRLVREYRLARETEFAHPTGPDAISDAASGALFVSRSRCSILPPDIITRRGSRGSVPLPQ
jgi:hypothetical protein